MSSSCDKRPSGVKQRNDNNSLKFFKVLIFVFVMLLNSPSQAQLWGDPFDSLSNTEFKVTLKKLIYITVKFDSLPSFAIRHKFKSEQRLPHCSELIFDRDFKYLAYDYRNKLDYDANGLVSNTFVVVDYRGNGKTLSNGGDNVLLRVLRNKSDLNIFAALDSSKIGYSIDSKSDSFARKSFDYKIEKQIYSEIHEFKVFKNLEIHLMKQCCCD